MRKILILVLVVFAFSCQQNKKAEVNNNSDNPEFVKVEFRVIGMHCTNCENSVAKGVNELKGIESVSASFNDSIAIVEFDKSKTNKSEIIKQIEKRGYEVKGEINSSELL